MSKRGGFRRQLPLYALKFEGDEYDGLEIMARSLPLREFFELQDLQLKANTDSTAAQQVIKKLCNVIVSWNLEDEDSKPVPVTYDALVSYDLPFVLTILGAWMEAVATVPNLSKGNSNDGATSPELSIPMDVL